MAVDRKIEHPTAKDDPSQRRTLDVLDDPRTERRFERRLGGLDHPRPLFVAQPGEMTQRRICLTRRARMNRIELLAVSRHIFQRIALYEGERIARLRLDIHADDLGEARAVVSHRSAAGSAEQIEQLHAALRGAAWGPAAPT